MGWDKEIDRTDLAAEILRHCPEGLPATKLKREIQDRINISELAAEQAMQKGVNDGRIILGDQLKLFAADKQKLVSKIDSSINFVEQQLTGFIESRYVRRSADYFIGYLSSQTGCSHMCKMCHLTQTGQTMNTNCSKDDFLGQMSNILNHYDYESPKDWISPAKYMHVNFMARGEPLANPDVNGDLLLNIYSHIREKLNMPVKFNISTIMPKTFKDKSLVKLFQPMSPTIYYSIYSIRDEFRKKWLPAAMPINLALEKLAEYQKMTQKVIKFHGAFIKGENDSYPDVIQMVKYIRESGIKHSEFNIVRYNPFSEHQGQETDEFRLKQIMYTMQSMGVPTKIIPRVGEDVKASCGTFIR